MPRAIQKQVRVKRGGVIELEAPELAEGTLAEVTIVPREGARERERLVRELGRLFKEIQALPSSKAMTEEEIAEEIAAYRAGK